MKNSWEVIPARQAQRCVQLKGSVAWKAASVVTLGTVGMLSKAFLYGTQSVTTHGREAFVKMLQTRKRPVISVCNHISVMDEPLLWGVMPAKTLFNPTHVRWSMGSADICFTNKVLSTFFSSGQTLATYRHGAGMFQPALDDAITLLSQSNAWLHVFPEGRIRQSKDYSMRYFKWGISRIVLETAMLGELPIIVPFFIEGFDQVMHESREWPRFLPRVGKKITVTFGEPIDDAIIQPYVDKWQQMVAEARQIFPDNEDDPRLVPFALNHSQAAKDIRRELAKELRDAVSKLRLQAGYPAENPHAHDARYYLSDEGYEYDVVQGGVPRPAIFKKKDAGGEDVIEKDTFT
ncbi:acyltransferase-domain-containing protein [Protomyces lactucae-debilis]|uniref:Tafazzin family protein n=1 Tax=Protomyces lactucae-debilis TaxID=2754530 RepID=A0A1Y2FIS6_PROLT|nr:acyltransferase-domain-containing protein [Protomyces lactucae-debilis]ORY83284.1 acyltransferase-domain-containing protein [Protomyces lactucae-debilis]